MGAGTAAGAGRAADALESGTVLFFPRLRFRLGDSETRFLSSAWSNGKAKNISYDHIMLCLHNAMKRDAGYQREASKTRVEFPAGSTWAVFSDRVPHAALAGQFALEQTFYLPVGAMQQEQLAPLRILEQRFHMPLA